MKPEILPRRLGFAFPFAILTGPDTVRLVAGEEFRYTLRSTALERWLPQFLSRFEHVVEWQPFVDELPTERRRQALDIVTRLFNERALLEGNGEHARLPSPLRWEVEGSGKLSGRLRAAMPAAPLGARRLAILCQDSLDYADALDFNRRCQKSDLAGWLWVSSGPMVRGFVSPIFRPYAGPCLGCLIRSFKRLSPTPEIYEHLMEHSRAGGTIPPAPFPDPAFDLLETFARWKIEASTQPDPSAAVYRLQVLEIATMSCSTHRVFRDHHCPDCSRI